MPRYNNRLAEYYDREIGPRNIRADRMNAAIRGARVLARAAGKVDMKEAKKAFDKWKRKKPKVKAKAKRVVKNGGRRNITNNVHTYSAIPHPFTKVGKLKKQYPHVLGQTFYITNKESYTDLNPGIDGTITNPDAIYSTPSILWTNASVMLFNIHNTETYWRPGIDALSGYRTGTQLTNEPADTQMGTDSTFSNDSFIFMNDPTSVRLNSIQSPFKQNALAESAVMATTSNVPSYTIPNSVLSGINIDLKVSNPTIQDQYISLKVIRLNNGDETLTPGYVGPDNAARTAIVNTMCNSGRFTNPQQFSTVWSTRFRIRAIRPGTKLKYYDIKKKLTMNYLRSQYRKQYNANNMTSIGLDARPSYVLSDDNSFFNSCFVVLSSQCIDNEYIADVQVDKGGATAPDMYSERMPQVTKYPPKGIPSNVAGGVYNPVAKGAQFCVSGKIDVFHWVQSKKRSIGSDATLQLFKLQSQIDELKAKKDYNESGGKFKIEMVD